MQNISYTVAKIDHVMWERIEKGEKRIEVRNEPFDFDYVLFLDAYTGDALGLVSVRETMLVHYEDNIKHILAEIAQCSVAVLSGYLNLTDDNFPTIWLSYVEPLNVTADTLQSLAVAADRLTGLEQLDEVLHAQ